MLPMEARSKYQMSSSDTLHLSSQETQGRPGNLRDPSVSIAGIAGCSLGPGPRAE